MQIELISSYPVLMDMEKSVFFSIPFIMDFHTC